MLSASVLDSALCLLLFHLLCPILSYFPKEICLGPLSLYPACSELSLLPPSALHYAMLEYTAVLGGRGMRKEKTPLTSDPTACTSIPNSISIPHCALSLIMHVCVLVCIQCFPHSSHSPRCECLLQVNPHHVSSALRVGGLLSI